MNITFSQAKKYNDNTDDGYRFRNSLSILFPIETMSDDAVRNITSNEVSTKYKKLSLKHHTDKGGNQEIFQAINAANTFLREGHLASCIVSVLQERRMASQQAERAARQQAARDRQDLIRRHREALARCRAKLYNAAMIKLLDDERKLFNEEVLLAEATKALPGYPPYLVRPSTVRFTYCHYLDEADVGTAERAYQQAKAALEHQKIQLKREQKLFSSYCRDFLVGGH